MSKLSKNTIEMIHKLLSDVFHQNYPQSVLSKDEKAVILNSVFSYDKVNVYSLYRTFYMNVEEDYYRYLMMQESEKILEFPIGIGAAMSGIRVFWVKWNESIYQVETDMEIGDCKLVVRRF